MALTRPSLPDQITMDVADDTEISFSCYNSEEWDGYNVKIINDETNTIHFTTTVNTSSNKFVIKSGECNLSNGVEYRIQIQTFKGDESSEYSDSCAIICYTKPVCIIKNIEIVEGERIVPTQNFTFEGEYSQSEMVGIKTFNYVLYDQYENVIQIFDKQYVSNAPANYDQCNQKVEGFSPQTEYYIELQCVDQHNLQISSGRIKFFVDYRRPRITQVVDLENEKDTASVKISSSMIQILFKVDDEPPVFINGQEIALCEVLDAEGNVIEGTKHTRAYLDERIDITGNFTMKLYARKLPTTAIGEESYFLTLTSIDGNTLIQMKESEGRIHVYKTVKPKPSGALLVSHYVSPVIEGYVPNESYLVIQINHVNRRIDVHAQVTEMVA